MQTIFTIQKEVKTIEDVDIKVNLPLYSKKKYSGQYFSIDIKGTLTSVYLANDYNSVQIFHAGSQMTTRSHCLQEAFNADPITQDEFIEALASIVPKYAEEVV